MRSILRMDEFLASALTRRMDELQVKMGSLYQSSRVAYSYIRHSTVRPAQPGNYPLVDKDREIRGKIDIVKKQLFAGLHHFHFYFPFRFFASSREYHRPAPKPQNPKTPMANSMYYKSV